MTHDVVINFYNPTQVAELASVSVTGNDKVEKVSFYRIQPSETDLNWIRVVIPGANVDPGSTVKIWCPVGIRYDFDDYKCTKCAPEYIMSSSPWVKHIEDMELHPQELPAESAVNGFIQKIFRGQGNLDSFKQNFVFRVGTVAPTVIIQNLGHFFQGCTKLTENNLPYKTMFSIAPDTLFKENTRNIEYMYAGTGIKVIPSDFFDSFRRLSYFFNTFAECLSLTSPSPDNVPRSSDGSIPGNVSAFDHGLKKAREESRTYQPQSCNFAGMFRGCTSLVNMPEWLFWYMPSINITSTQWLFADFVSECSSLTKVPRVFGEIDPDYFVPQDGTGRIFYNSSMFRQCTSLTEVHEDFFKNIGKTFSRGNDSWRYNSAGFTTMFQGTKIKVINPKWIWDCPYCTSFVSAFQNLGTSLTAPIPENLFWGMACRYISIKSLFRYTPNTEQKTMLPKNLFRRIKRDESGNLTTNLTGTYTSGARPAGNTDRDKVYDSDLEPLIILNEDNQYGLGGLDYTFSDGASHGGFQEGFWDGVTLYNPDAPLSCAFLFSASELADTYADGRDGARVFLEKFQGNIGSMTGMFAQRKVASNLDTLLSGLEFPKLSSLNGTNNPANGTFSDNSLMEGTAMPYINGVFSKFTGDWPLNLGVFRGCTLIGDYNSLPNYWKGW
jgi:hypothetical protein